MNIFEFDGEKYKQASVKLQREWGRRMIAGLELKGNEQILDLGCGDGALTEQLAELVPGGKVTGIDASVGMIQTAKKCQKDNLTFICMDINDLDYENCFDVVFSNATLHWIKNHERLLNNVFKALKTNGIIRWNFATEGNCSNFIEIIKTVMDEPAYKAYFENFEWPWFMPAKAEYEKLIANTGFHDIHIEYENADKYFTDSDEMIQWINQPTIVPFIMYIPDNEKEKFRNLVIDRMIEKSKQPDGRCFEMFRRLIIKAEK